MIRFSILSIYLYIYLPMTLHSLWTLGAFSVFNLCIVGRTPWTGDQPVARSLPTHRATQTQYKGIQTSIPQVGFEPMIPVFERAKTVHALGRAAAVIGRVLAFILWHWSTNILSLWWWEEYWCRKLLWHPLLAQHISSLCIQIKNHKHIDKYRDCQNWTQTKTRKYSYLKPADDRNSVGEGLLY
jgi:hypothetical protein